MKINRREYLKSKFKNGLRYKKHKKICKNKQNLKALSNKISLFKKKIVIRTNKIVKIC
jgi:hypothetical protein